MKRCVFVVDGRRSQMWDGPGPAAVHATTVCRVQTASIQGCMIQVAYPAGNALPRPPPRSTRSQWVSRWSTEKSCIFCLKSHSRTICSSENGTHSEHRVKVSGQSRLFPGRSSRHKFRSERGI